MAARRGPVFGVVLVAQLLVGMALAAVFAIVRAEPLPAVSDLGWAVAAGIAGSMGLTALYHGLATGRIATVAPLAGILAAAIPVVVGWTLQGTPAALQVVGIAAAIVAVVLVSTSGDPQGDRPSDPFGLLAGAGFGLFNVSPRASPMGLRVRAARGRPGLSRRPRSRSSSLAARRPVAPPPAGLRAGVGRRLRDMAATPVHPVRSGRPLDGASSTYDPPGG
jgi:uncharacterized membrane protein